MKKFKFEGGAMVSCAVCGKYPDYGEEYLLLSLEEFSELKDRTCPPHKILEAPDPERLMNAEIYDVVIGHLRKEFPHGHQDFIPLLIEAMKLHSYKNYGYAFGGDALSNFDRRATILGLYPNLDDSNPVVIAAKDILKQLDAGLWQLNIGHTAKDETIIKRFMDVLVYAGLVILLAQEGDKASKEEP